MSEILDAKCRAKRNVSHRIYGSTENGKAKQMFLFQYEPVVSASSVFISFYFQYIREHYKEDADSYKNECSQLEQLRSVSLSLSTIALHPF